MFLIGLSVLLAACSSSGRGASTAPATSNASTTSTTTVVAAAAVPTLGRVWSPGGQQGYGQVRPSSIFNGGDPTGRLEHVRWASWGTPRAIGSGSGYRPQQTVADGTKEPATVVAFKLATCKGIRAYTAIEWYFPKHGGKFDPKSYIDICTGDYVGKAP